MQMHNVERRVLRMHRDGHPARYIAKHVGVTLKMVQDIIARMR
jgi:hypothetical protein